MRTTHIYTCSAICYYQGKQETSRGLVSDFNPLKPFPLYSHWGWRDSSAVKSTDCSPVNLGSIPGSYVSAQSCL